VHSCGGESLLTFIHIEELLDLLTRLVGAVYGLGTAIHEIRSHGESAESELPFESFAAVSHLRLSDAARVADDRSPIEYGVPIAEGANSLMKAEMASLRLPSDVIIELMFSERISKPGMTSEIYELS
jgi:hypothetical protein